MSATSGGESFADVMSYLERSRQSIDARPNLTFDIIKDLKDDIFVLCDAGGGTVDVLSCKVPPMAQQRYKFGTFSTQRKSKVKPPACDPVIKGTIFDIKITALADTCAVNLISEQFLGPHKPFVDVTARRSITLADGSSFSTIGTVKAPWTFYGENTQHMIDFNVVPSNFCKQYAVVLGGVFLKKSRTLAEFTSRIMRRPRDLFRQMVRFQSSSELRMSGLCEGRHVLALPDSAADICLMSPEFAAKLGKRIDRHSTDSRLELELPGDRFAWTEGVVRDVRWTFGDDIHYLDFHVLPGLPAELLLADQFLEDTNAFLEYADLVSDEYERDCGLDTGLFLTIRLKQREEDPGGDEQAVLAFRAKEALLMSEIRKVLNSDKTPEDQRAEIALLNERLALLQNILRKDIATFQAVQEQPKGRPRWLSWIRSKPKSQSSRPS